MRRRAVRRRVQMKGTTVFIALHAAVELVRFLHSLRSVGMTVGGGRSVGMTVGGGRSVGMTVGPPCHPDRRSGATERRDLP